MRATLDLIRTFPNTTAIIVVMLILLPVILEIVDLAHRIATRTM
jgi:hypothetical protein